MKLTTKEFYRFSEQRYKLNSYAQRMRDGRKQPEIPAGTVFMMMVLMIAWGQRHFLQMDQLARRRSVKRLMGCPERAMVCSDSTLERSLRGFKLGWLPAVLAHLYQSQPIQAVQVKVGRHRLRLGALDGSQFGRFLACGLLILGPSVDLWLDAEPMEKRGTELPTSHRLLRRCVKRLGPGFLDLLLLDGLYVAQDFINDCLQAQIDVAIKTDEEELLILQQANALFDHHQRLPGVEVQQGGDSARGCQYQVWACGDCHHRGVQAPLWVARVREVYPKAPPDKQHRLFYVVTTRPGLSAMELRELGHWRWHVENQGFRRLNALCHTKRVFTHNDHSFLAALLIFLVAFNLLHLFAAQIEPSWLQHELGQVRVTLSLICSVLLESWVTQYGDLDSS